MIKPILIMVIAIVCCLGLAFYSGESTSSWLKIIWYVCLTLTIILIIVQGIDSIFSSNELKNLNNQLYNVQKYGEISTWNLAGSKSISKDYCLPDKLTGWTDGYVEDEIIRYDDDAIAHYLTIMKLYPDYPFSYYLLAEAYRLRGDVIWESYAEKGIRILEITTSILGHAPNHDEVLNNLRKMLANADK